MNVPGFEGVIVHRGNMDLVLDDTWASVWQRWNRAARALAERRYLRRYIRSVRRERRAVVMMATPAREWYLRISGRSR